MSIVSPAGKLLVFEGVDEVGKTTISKEVVAELSANGQKCLWYAFPGRQERTIGSLIYNIHHNLSAFNVDNITASSLQTLHIAAHLDAIESVLLPKLAEGFTVVLDRFWWSTWVYGITNGIEKSLLRALLNAEVLAWRNTVPAQLFLITRMTPFRGRPSEGWTLVAEEYLRLAQEELGKYPIRVLPNNGSLQDGVRLALDFL